METFVASLRIIIATMLVCVVAYTAAILGMAQALRDRAEGSLLTDPSGTVIGSRLIAQSFTKPRYFWPRPSAVGYDAASAGGSNKAATSRDLTQRARESISRYGASAANPLPAGLAAASGSGLDPHISERAALYQVERVSRARGLPRERVEALVEEHASTPSASFVPDRLVNVLELNVALDARGGER
jgi:potassium-transporting ATPase KdpC subunit